MSLNKVGIEIGHPKPLERHFMISHRSSLKGNKNNAEHAVQSYAAGKGCIILLSNTNAKEC